MNAYLSDLESRRSPFDPPPVLIAGDSEPALARAARSVEASGVRVADKVLVEAALERIDQQASASALWVELERDGGEPMDGLLARVNRDVADGRYAAVISAHSSLVDVLAARIDDSSIELIIDADDAERAAALAVALASRNQPFRVADAAAEKNAARLRQLSDEVSRIASTLARLSAGPGATIRPAEAPPAEVPEVSAETVRAVIRARRLRARYFQDGLFADPAWDMLLDLLQAEIAQLRVPVSSLCIAAAVPATTALRWLKSMTNQGMFVRRADPHDGRRVFVELAPETSIALRRYFAEVGKVAVI
ncbi:MAG TPA: MarR family transcriptional regulator [Sphingomicrobium sp.]|nr:MarR family transcriptional regulator [Sphingomicrobium sp.]